MPEVRSSNWISLGQNQGAGLTSLGRFRERICSLAFSSFYRLPASLGSWPYPPASKPAEAGLVCLVLHPSGSDSPASLLYLQGCLQLNWAHWIIQDHLPAQGQLLSNLNSTATLTPYVTSIFTGSRGSMDVDGGGGGIILPTTHTHRHTHMPTELQEGTDCCPSGLLLYA